jgi:hypothetical protein
MRVCDFTPMVTNYVRPTQMQQVQAGKQTGPETVDKLPAKVSTARRMVRTPDGTLVVVKETQGPAVVVPEIKHKEFVCIKKPTSNGFTFECKTKKDHMGVGQQMATMEMQVESKEVAKENTAVKEAVAVAQATGDPNDVAIAKEVIAEVERRRRIRRRRRR